jgi:hypothetical protein
MAAGLGNHHPHRNTGFGAAIAHGGVREIARDRLADPGVERTR